MDTIQTTDSQIAAACVAGRHTLRQEIPCSVTFRGKDTIGIFYIEENPEADLSVAQILAAWADRGACDRAEQYFLSLVPPDQQPEARQLFFSAMVQAMHMHFCQAKESIRPVFYEAKKFASSIETRGGQTLAVDLRMQESEIAELKTKGGF